MENILFFDFGCDGSVEENIPLFLMDGAWVHHHGEAEFQACAQELKHRQVINPSS